MGPDAVVVEADAIRNADVIYRSLARRREFAHDLSLDELVHEYATKEAEALLVAAINARRDIVFDGTHAWAPFVEQTIAMARDAGHTYRMGPGYVPAAAVAAAAAAGDAAAAGSAGSAAAVELYWQRDAPAAAPPGGRPPYRIELVGVACDPALAVARGVWRRLRTGRSVPVRAQLRSHRLFADNFERCARGAGGVGREGGVT